MKGLLKLALIGAIESAVMAASGFDTPPPGFNGSTNGNNNQNISIRYPQNTDPAFQAMPEQLRENNYQINIDGEEAKGVHRSFLRYKKMMDGTYDANVIQDVSFRPLKAMDNLYLMSNYTTVVTFPEQYKITKSISSSDLKDNRVSQNVLMLSPNKNFLEGNVVVSLTDGQKNLIVNLIVEKFIAGGNIQDDQVNLFVTYVEVPRISDYELLKVYFQMYGKERIDYFDKNGKFDIIEYKKIPFRLTRDDVFGEIEFMGINFKISN